jgi:hypothetical protein
MQKNMQEKGYQRSSVNLLSLYQKNKNFLSFNKNCTGKELAAILADHYETIE